MANVYVRSGASGAANGTTKTDAYTTLAAAFAASAAGDAFYVASDHAETQASAMTLTPPGTAASPNSVLCVDFAGSTPPVAADLATTATISTTGTNAMTLSGGYCYFYGITFNNGTGAGAASFTILTSAGNLVLQSCQLCQTNTATSSLFNIGGTAGNISCRLELIDTVFGFQNVSQAISLRCGRMIWRSGTSSAVKTGGSFVVPTDLFRASGRTGTARGEGLDLSQLGSGKTIVGANTDSCEYWFKDCKTHASVTLASTPTAPGAGEAYFTRCDSSANSYQAGKFTYQGTQSTETAVVRTGGASDGTTAASAKIVTTANAEWQSPFEALPIAAWNATVGSSVDVTIEGVINAATVPNNDEVWIDVEGLATSGSPLGGFVSGTKATILTSAAALDVSTEAWDSIAAARANTTAYVLGDAIKLASNAGRIFFCTTAGTSAGSEPGGYASAVDGGSVTDGTAVFRAGCRFSQTVAITPQIAGAVYAYAKVAKVSSTVYLDRKITLS